MASLEGLIDAARNPGKPAAPATAPSAPTAAPSSAEGSIDVARGLGAPAPVAMPAPASPSPADLPGYFNRPAGMSTGDWLGKAWEATTRTGGQTGVAGMGQAAADYSRSIPDQLTIGGADLLQSKLTGEPVEAIRARTAASKAEIGAPMNAITGTAAYALGPGKVAGLARGAGVLGKGIMGTALEGAAAGGGETALHGGSLLDTAVGAATGGAVGGGAGVFGLGAGTAARKVADWFGFARPEAVTSALDATQQLKYGQLDSIKYDPNAAKAGVDTASARVYAGDDGTFRQATPQTNRLLNRYSGAMAAASTSGTDASATGLHTLVKDLKGVQAKGGADAVAATEALGHIRGTDTTPGMFDILRPTQGPANASQILRDADQAHSAFKNAQMIEGMRSRLDKFGDMPGPAAKQQLVDNPQFYDQASQDALMGIQKTGMGGPSTWSLAKSVHPLVSGAIGAGLGMTGHMAEAIPGAATYLAIAPALHAAEVAASRAGARRAITSAYPALTGQALANPEQATGDMVKNLMLGQLNQGSGRPGPLDYVPKAAAPLLYSF